jgi:short-subunit dehydrogenase
VLLADMNDAALAAVVGRLNAPKDRILTAVANLTDTDSRAALCAQARTWRVNVLINNAGVNHFGLYEELGEAAITQTVTVNVLVPMLLTHALLPHFIAQPAAHILNIGSVFGVIGYPGYAAYSASKFATRGFSEALRRELADTTVRVQHLSPRATRTPINSGPVEKMNAELRVAMDPPTTVAREVRALLESNRASTVVGWPEKLFARINAVLPGVVDGSIARQLPVIRRYARKSS